MPTKTTQLRATPDNPHLLRRAAAVEIVELPDGRTLAAARGDAGTWYCADRSANVAVGSATMSAVYGDPYGDSFFDRISAIRCAPCRTTVASIEAAIVASFTS